MQRADDLYDLDHRAWLVPVLVHLHGVALVLLFRHLGDLSLDVFRGRVRVADVAIWAIRLQHKSVKRYFLDHFKVFLSLETAAIDSDEKTHFQELIKLLLISSERVHYSSSELVAIFSNQSSEVPLC